MHSLVNDVEWLLVVIWREPSAEWRLPVTLASRSAANVVGRGTNHLDCAAGQSHVCAQKREICLKAKFPTFSLHWNIRPQVPDEKFVSKILSCSEEFLCNNKKISHTSAVQQVAVGLGLATPRNFGGRTLLRKRPRDPFLRTLTTPEL